MTSSGSNHYSQDSFESYHSDTETVSSRYREDIATNTQISNTTVKKKRKQPIPAAVKRIVWNKYIGETIGKSKCLCCNVTEITQLSFHCGHVIAEANGGTIDITNLRPICQNCNSSMRTMNMDDFINKYRLHDTQNNNKK